MFLNDDMEILSEDWVERMICFLEDPTVGLVGPLLLLDNFLIQSAGHTAAPPSHFAMRLPPTAGAGGGRPLDLNREVSGITGACMAVRKDTFFDVGGFSVDFPLNFNDVDFGFKIYDRGLRIIWTPDARLFHFESKSRESPSSRCPSGTASTQLWGRLMKRDPFLPHTSTQLLVEERRHPARRSLRWLRRPAASGSDGSSQRTDPAARSSRRAQQDRHRRDAPCQRGSPALGGDQSGLERRQHRLRVAGRRRRPPAVTAASRGASVHGLPDGRAVRDVLRVDTTQLDVELQEARRGVVDALDGPRSGACRRRTAPRARRGTCSGVNVQQWQST